MYDIIIIGAGVAGMTAALYSLRSGKTVLILEGGAIGGQISNSPKVENFPTIPEISGSDLADRLFNQVTDSGAECEYEQVTSVQKCENGLFTVTTEFSEYSAKSVICAAGVTHKHMGIASEAGLVGNGVYYCALCDGPFYKGKEVALIGDGNTAMQYALVLSNICSKVYLLTWFDKFFGDKLVEKAVRARENIVIMPETMVTDFKGENRLSAIEYVDKKSGEKRILSVPAVFVAIGQVPNNDIFVHLADVDKQGYFTPEEDMSTKTPGFFVAGDCRAKGVRQLSTAISDGAVAAVSACAYLDKIM